ncbi:MAG: xanthine dehydrogenase family protein molybdopterin-binding subunit, partial [Boseongicola sp.]|nr:xanthine dehydrogenase family protein molybdopterin-binding subunit [Boseongicola sp.]
MEKFGSAQPHRRREDQRFITGTGRYVADTAPKGSLHAVFVRSQVGHGVLEPVDLSDAREMPGVRLALAAADLAEMGITGTIGATVLEGGADPRRQLLAEDR